LPDHRLFGCALAGRLAASAAGLSLASAFLLVAATALGGLRLRSSAEAVLLFRVVGGHVLERPHCIGLVFAFVHPLVLSHFLRDVLCDPPVYLLRLFLRHSSRPVTYHVLSTTLLDRLVFAFGLIRQYLDRYGRLLLIAFATTVLNDLRHGAAALVPEVLEATATSATAGVHLLATAATAAAATATASVAPARLLARTAPALLPAGDFIFEESIGASIIGNVFPFGSG
jgi:hypothetical protein